MKGFLKEYFSFGKSERIAIVLILMVIVLLILLPRIYSSHRPPEPIVSDSFATEIEAFRKIQEQTPVADRSDFDYNNPDKSAARVKIKPFAFNPNSLEKEGWIKLGFTEKQASGIVKFREKGGRFFKKEDLKKLYAVTNEIYELLEPFVEIPAAPAFDQTAHKDYTTDRPVSKYNPTQNKTELNSADSATLVKVYGIGPAIAKRILKYREKLGGFTEIEQLREVFSIDSARYTSISKNVFADTSLIRKININTATIEEMRKHPYIDYYIAKAIVDKRVKKGAYSSTGDVRSIALIYNELYLKLKPYLTTAEQ